MAGTSGYGRRLRRYSSYPPELAASNSTASRSSSERTLAQAILAFVLACAGVVSAIDAERMLSIVGNDTLAPVAAQVRDKLAARRFSCGRNYRGITRVGVRWAVAG